MSLRVVADDGGADDTRRGRWRGARLADLKPATSCAPRPAPPPPDWSPIRVEKARGGDTVTGCGSSSSSARALGCQKPVKPGDPSPGSPGRSATGSTAGRSCSTAVHTRNGARSPLYATGCGDCHENPAGGRRRRSRSPRHRLPRPVATRSAQEGGPVDSATHHSRLKQALGIDQEPFPPSATARAMRTSRSSSARPVRFSCRSVLLTYADPGDRTTMA